MKRVLSAFGAVIISVFFVSCQQEIRDTDSNPGSGGTGGNTSATYQPLGANSFWKFKDSASATQTTMTATNITRNINGRNFTAVISTSGTNSDTAYMGKIGADYFLYAKDVSPNSGAPYELLFHYLNDTASVGYNWEYRAGQGNGFTAIIKTTIAEKGISHTVEGKTYPDVIHTVLDFYYDLFGMVIHAATYDYYIAKGVGIVRVRAELDMLGTFLKSTSNLTEYQIR